MPNAHAPDPVSSMASEVENVLPGSGCQDATSGVNISDNLMPDSGMRDREIDSIAFPDMAREHQSCEDREIVERIFNV